MIRKRGQRTDGLRKDLPAHPNSRTVSCLDQSPSKAQIVGDATQATRYGAFSPLEKVNKNRRMRTLDARRLHLYELGSNSRNRHFCLAGVALCGRRPMRDDLHGRLAVGSNRM